MKKRTKWLIGLTFVTAVFGVAGFYTGHHALFVIPAGATGFCAGFLIALDKVYAKGNNGKPMNDATMTAVLEEIL